MCTQWFTLFLLNRTIFIFRSERGEETIWFDYDVCFFLNFIFFCLWTIFLPEILIRSSTLANFVQLVFWVDRFLIFLVVVWNRINFGKTGILTHWRFCCDSLKNNPSDLKRSPNSLISTFMMRCDIQNILVYLA